MIANIGKIRPQTPDFFCVPPTVRRRCVSSVRRGTLCAIKALKSELSRNRDIISTQDFTFSLARWSERPHFDARQRRAATDTIVRQNAAPEATQPQARIFAHPMHKSPALALAARSHRPTITLSGAPSSDTYHSWRSA